ncbi:MAG: ferredoxin [Clostridia bacterium]|nr:ferredoxin [Clostridia bacterium]
MKAFIDKDTCIGCGNCVAECPRVFKIGTDDKAEVIVDEIPKEQRKSAKDAESGCPVEAITIEE